MPFKDPEKGREYQRQRYLDNRERLIEASKKRYQDKSEDISVKRKERYWKDPDKARQATIAYSDAHREEKRKYDSEYQKNNPDRVRMRNERRRMRKLNAFVEDVKPLVVLELDDGICGICGEDVDPLKFHVDHVIPLSRGGEHSYMNTQVAHPLCNHRKGSSYDSPERH